jgi:ssDNA-binding Zn-finger/Zn-ribbon topoisomerase 1
MSYTEDEGYYCDEYPHDVGDTCPDCDGTLVMRKTKLTKTEFLGCSNFPLCTFTETL